MGRLSVASIYWLTLTVIEAEMFGVWLWILKHFTNVLIRLICTLGFCYACIVLLVLFYTFWINANKKWRILNERKM